MSIKGKFPIDKWSFRSESILKDLPAADLALLMANREERVYEKNDIIFKEGAYPSGIYYITEGKVKKYKKDDSGREQIIYLANTGQLIGYHAILSEGRYPDSAAAMEESRLAFIPREDFLNVLHTSPVLNSRLLKTLSQEFAVLVNSISVFAQKTARERLALQLILLREKYKVEGIATEINISRDDLAAMVGTARENVVRLLTEFKEAKILETKGSKIRIHDIGQLIAIAGHK
ncbi:Crp/Fnr family transcriptional regulator [Chitinophaga vietnamensis]|uniref:Crp/Fnr family transcriptional regulator n=1 Tax=Chitinophaga vietnamensis TaxID=2593957 RepID=UPI0011787EF8|nr:Crp/Fnr family transcriptional regulator [Chitinophaga vietnamensis]